MHIGVKVNKIMLTSKNSKFFVSLILKKTPPIFRDPNI